MTDSGEKERSKAQEIYEESFRRSGALALQHALDIRKFEIELYWKRSGYFWTLIGASFAAYFLILGSKLECEDKQFPCFIISCVGFIFSLAWHLASRGSKFWQENWEAHVDILENTVVGPLYKTVLYQIDDSTWKDNWHKYHFIKSKFRNFVCGTSCYSVSKLNIILGMFTCLIWFLLILASVPGNSSIIFKFANQGLQQFMAYRNEAVLLITATFCMFLLVFGKSSPKPSLRLEARMRESEIVKTSRPTEDCTTEPQRSAPPP